MYMIGHHTPCKNLPSVRASPFHAFFFLTIMKPVNKDLFILIPGKNIQPFYHGKANKIYSFGLIEFVISAHESNINIFFASLPKC